MSDDTVGLISEGYQRCFSVAQARQLAAELLATAALAESAAQPMAREQEAEEAMRRGY